MLLKFENDSFNYWKFIFRKIMRLWPLIIIASAVSLAIGSITMLPDDYENLSESVVASYIIGNKSYGESNGIIYAHRKSKTYYEQVVDLPKELIEQNRYNSELWGEHYIDMLYLLQNDDGAIRVFTNNGKLISQDCKHLTQAGAEYYSSILDFSMLDANILLKH